MVFLPYVKKDIDLIQIGNVPYQLHEVIGSGSFGIVVKAEDLITSIIYAIKIIPIPSSYDDFQKKDYMTRIALEVTALQQFKQEEHVVALRCAQRGLIGTNMLCFFLVMEFCDSDMRSYLDKRIKDLLEDTNESLDKDSSDSPVSMWEPPKVEKNKPIISEEEIKFWMTQLVDSLYAFHRYGFMHRDIKFENILIKKIIKPKVFLSFDQAKNEIDRLEKKKEELMRTSDSQPKMKMLNESTSSFSELLPVSTTSESSIFGSMKESDNKTNSGGDIEEFMDFMMSTLKLGGDAYKSMYSTSNPVPFTSIEDQQQQLEEEEEKEEKKDDDEVEGEEEEEKDEKDEEEFKKRPFLEYTLKLCDLGLAKKMETDLTQTFCGTPLNASPEILYKQSYSFKSDLWACGILMLEMVTGERTSVFKNLDMQLLRKNRDLALQEEVLKFSVEESIENLDISDKLRDLLTRVLDKNMDSRISIEDLVKHPFFSEEQEEQEVEKKKESDEEGKKFISTTSFNLYQTMEMAQYISKNESEGYLMSIQKRGEIDYSQSLEERDENKITVFLGKGIYKMTIFNVNRSKWRCFKVFINEKDGGLMEKKNISIARIHFEQEVSGSYVEKKPLEVTFAVSKRMEVERDFRLTISFEPSWWTSYWRKKIRYKVMIQKKDLSKL